MRELTIVGQFPQSAQHLALTTEIKEFAREESRVTPIGDSLLYPFP
jgi:hypothetical protein